MAQMQRILVTGATGFVGAHLHARLAQHGYAPVGATRNPEGARRRFPDREYRFLEMNDESSVREALRGMDAAVYLVHSMADTKDYEQAEGQAAQGFARAAEQEGITRIVYLGGAQPLAHPSRHLRSRQHTGEVLRAGKVPCVELQASMIIGAGSESFRIVRDLSARLPIMLLPRWLETRTQPIALDDVLYALTLALQLPLERSCVYALPGPEVMSGRDILQRTSRLLGIRPFLFRLPFVTPRLSSYWITFVTRADKHVSRELVEGLKFDLVSPDDGFWALAKDYVRLSYEEAVRRCLEGEEQALNWRGRMLERVIRALVAHPRRARRPPLLGSRP